MTDRFQDLLCDQLISRRVRTVLTPIRLPYFDLAKGLANIGWRDPRVSIPG
jgi:hypothetical protein